MRSLNFVRIARLALGLRNARKFVPEDELAIGAKRRATL
jgi:hypothetical protein